jgi:hypothetical protein
MSWRGLGLWPYFLAPRGAIGFRPSRSSASLAWHRHLRGVHCWRLASAGPETGGSLQHPVAEAAATGMVSTGFARPVRPPAPAQDQAAHRAALASCRGKTRARVARARRRDRQDRARVQRGLACLRSGVTSACKRLEIAYTHSSLGLFPAPDARHWAAGSRLRVFTEGSL